MFPDCNRNSFTFTPPESKPTICFRAIHSATKTKREVQRGLPLDAVVAQSEAVLEPLGREGQYLQVRRDVCLVLDLVGTQGGEVCLCVWVGAWLCVLIIARAGADAGAGAHVHGCELTFFLTLSMESKSPTSSVMVFPVGGSVTKTCRSQHLRNRVLHHVILDRSLRMYKRFRPSHGSGF